MNVNDKLRNVKKEHHQRNDAQEAWLKKAAAKLRRELTVDEKNSEIDNFTRQWKTKSFLPYVETDDESASEEKYISYVRQDEMIDALYRQLENHYQNFTSDTFQLATICASIDELAILHCIELENTSAEEMIDVRVFNSGFLEMIRRKYTNSYINHIKANGGIDYNRKTHYFYKLASEDIALDQSKELGFKFLDSDNLLGWELHKDGTAVVQQIIQEKINWEGSQVTLACLINWLKNRKFITNHNPFTLTANYFTVKGTTINKDSLKTESHRISTKIKLASELPVKQREILNLIGKLEIIEKAINDISALS